MVNKKTGVKNQGFASMSPERQRALASLGGIKSHELGKAHEFTPEEARIAGKLGGIATSLKRKLKNEKDSN